MKLSPFNQTAQSKSKVPLPPKRPAGEVVRVSADDFPDKVWNEEKPVFVSLGFDGCKPCDAIKPTLEQLAKSHGGRAKVVAVDTGQGPAASDRSWGPRRTRYRCLPERISR